MEQKIKGYRNQHGVFIKPEDIMERKSNPYYSGEKYTIVYYENGGNIKICNDSFSEPLKDESKAQKFDDDKNRVDLLPPLALQRIAEIFTFGANKYSSWDWSKGLSFSRLYGALLRHVFAWFRGERNDPESGKSHLYHAGCCIMMLIEMNELRPDLDDRPIHYKKEINVEVEKLPWE